MMKLKVENYGESPFPVREDSQINELHQMPEKALMQFLFL